MVASTIPVAGRRDPRKAGGTVQLVPRGAGELEHIPSQSPREGHPGIGEELFQPCFVLQAWMRWRWTPLTLM